MNPTVETFMAKLAQNPSEAIAFDNCRPDLTRRQHCQLVLSQVENSCTNVAESKRLADARITHAKLKQDLSAARARLAAAQIKASNSMKAKPTIATPQATTPVVKLTSAAEFRREELNMSRAQFLTLTAADKMRFSKAGGKLV